MSKIVWIVGCTPTLIMYNDLALVNEFENRRYDVRYLNFSEINLVKPGSMDDPIRLSYKDQILDNPHLIVLSQPFFQKNITPFIELKVKTIKALPCKIMNDIDAHLLVNDKNYVYKILQEQQIPIPKTLSVQTSVDSEKILALVEELGGYPIVLKHPVSSLGLGVFLCNNLEEVVKVVVEYKSDPNNKLPLIAQEYVRSSAGLTVSSRVIGENVHARYHLSSPKAPSSFKAELESGKHQIACKVCDNIREISLNASKALNLDVCRIDLFLTDSGYQVCEVNSLGSFYGMDVTNNLNQASMLVDLAVKKMKEN